MRHNLQLITFLTEKAFILIKVKLNVRKTLNDIKNIKLMSKYVLLGFDAKTSKSLEKLVLTSCSKILCPESEEVQEAHLNITLLIM